MKAVVRVGTERIPAVIYKRCIGCTREAESGNSSRAARSLNSVRPRRHVEAQLPFAKIAEAEFVHRSGTYCRSVRDVQLLRARCIVSGKIARRGARGLELGKGVQRVVVIEIVVGRGLLIVRPIMVDPNLELVAVIRFVRCDLHSAASASSGNVLQQAESDRVKTSNRNLIVVENQSVRRRRATTRHASYQGLRGGPTAFD